MAKKRTKSTDEIFNDMVRDEFNNNYYGNMDLTYRKGTKMPDGSRATVRSMSFQDGDGKETLIPTVARDGRIMNDNEAIDEYYRTGDNLGKFNNVEDANRAADAIHRNEEARLNDMFYNPAKYRSPELQASIERGRALRANPYQPTYDSPEIANRMQQNQADVLYDFARQNNIAGNGQGFSSRDYLNAVDMFDKYMKGETNDTSWSDFFDKHGLKPISRSNLEKRYRAAWNSDAGKGQGPVPTGEQQAIMQQAEQIQQNQQGTGDTGGGNPSDTYTPPPTPLPQQDVNQYKNLINDSLYAPDGSQQISETRGGGLLTEDPVIQNRYAKRDADIARYNARRRKYLEDFIDKVYR